MAAWERPLRSRLPVRAMSENISTDREITVRSVNPLSLADAETLTSQRVKIEMGSPLKLIFPLISREEVGLESQVWSWTRVVTGVKVFGFVQAGTVAPGGSQSTCAFPQVLPMLWAEATAGKRRADKTKATEKTLRIGRRRRASENWLENDPSKTFRPQKPFVRILLLPRLEV